MIALLHFCTKSTVMTKVQVRKQIKLLESNLDNSCSVNTITAAYNRIYGTTNCFIKVYDTIQDACLQNRNHRWVLLDGIVKLNNNRLIICSPCNQTCILSFKAKITKNHTQYYYCKINNVEIIY